MRSESSPLLPILRSRTQGELLALLLADPDREWSVTELARTLDAPLTTVQGEVARLEAGGILRSRKVGRARLVRPDTASPVFEPLSRLIAITFGPRVVVAEEFADLGADLVVIFGSWAARLAGDAGPVPADVDVLVVGDGVDRAAVYAAAESAESRIGRPVNPVLRTSRAWTDGSTDPLVDEIRRRAYVVVHGDETVGA